MGFFVQQVKRTNGYTDSVLNVKRVVYSSIGIIILLTLLIGTLTSIHSVDAGEVGIVTKFGEVQRVQTSGLAFTAPFIESMITMEIRVQKEEQSASAATKDLQDVNSTLSVNYALDNESALKVYKELGIDYKNRVITPSIQEVFKSVSAKFAASELITSRPEVKKIVVDEIATRLGKYGIRVVDVSLTDFSFSAAFNQAIESVQIANQNVAKAKQELETVKIEAEKAITKAKGEAEAQALQQQTLTPALLEKLAIEKWNGVTPTTMTSGSSIFSLPITK